MLEVCRDDLSLLKLDVSPQDQQEKVNEVERDYE
jgi:hypothetical protein